MASIVGWDTTTTVCACEPQLAALATVTTYKPVAAVVIFVMEGFCSEEVNPFGPVQLYVAPPLEVRFNVPPTINGELLPAVAIGRLFTTPDPVATVLSAAPVDEQTIFPDDPVGAVTDKRT